MHTQNDPWLMLSQHQLEEKTGIMVLHTPRGVSQYLADFSFAHGSNTSHPSTYFMLNMKMTARYRWCGDFNVLYRIRSNDNDSTGFWPPGLLHTLGADGHISQRDRFLCGLKFFALNIFCGEYPQSSLHLMLQIWWKPLLWKMCQ